VKEPGVAADAIVAPTAARNRGKRKKHGRESLACFVYFTHAFE